MTTTAVESATETTVAGPVEQPVLELSQILDRIREQWPEQTQKGYQLAAWLGVDPSNLSQWKSRGTIPYKELVQLGIRERIDLTYLFTGVGSGLYQSASEPMVLALNGIMLLLQGEDLLADAGIDGALSIISEVELALRKSGVELNVAIRVSALRYYAGLLKRQTLTAKAAKELLLEFCQAIALQNQYLKK